MTARPRAPIVVAVVLAAAVALVGCSPDSPDPDPVDDDPTDDAAPDPTDDGDDGPDLPTLADGDAARLYEAWRQLVAALPAMEPDQVTVDGAADGVAIPGSDAARQTEQALETAVELGIVERGDIHAETLQLSVRGDTATGQLCASHDVQTTHLESGEPTADDLPTRDQYLRIDVTYQHTDHGWQIDTAAATEPQYCVPPSIAQPIETNWHAYIDAHAAWGEAGADGDNLGPLEDLLTGDALELALDGIDIPDGTTIVTAGIAYDLQLHRATRTQATGDWCLDGTRNPDAGTHRPDGEFLKDVTRRAEQATWQLVDGEWRLAERLGTLRPDREDAPEDHRCF